MAQYPPHRRPNLFFIDDGVHSSTNSFHSWFSTNFSHWLIHSVSLLDCGSTNGGLGSTMLFMPFSIKNLKSKVGIVQRKLLWKSSWKRFLILSKESLSSIACSSQKSLTICSTHYDKLVLPPFHEHVHQLLMLHLAHEHICNNFWSACWMLSRNFSWVSMKIFACTCIRIILFCQS